jgi:hypothetical protein
LMPGRRFSGEHHATMTCNAVPRCTWKDEI